jgi:sucrose phosphorylase
MDLLAATGVGRDVNRHRYSPAEIHEALDRPIVRRLVELLRWRSTEPAFDGEFELLDSDDHVLAVRWSSPTSTITATVDLRSAEVTITS